MSVFIPGERVRILESEKDSEKIYVIKNMKKVRNGGILYLLKSLEEDSVLRLHYEDENFLLERVS